MLKKLLCVAAICLPIMSNAATLTVTSTVFDNTVSGTLPYCISHATSGDVIVFDNSLSGATITFTSVLSPSVQQLAIDATALASPITFDGNNATGMFNLIDTNPEYATPHILPVNVYSFKNIIFTKGLSNGDQAGAITSDAGTLTIENCSFTNNQPTGEPASGYNNGALRIKQPDANVIIRNCVFNGNRGRKGGVISLDGTNTLIEKCLFNNNSSFSAGAAIYVSDMASLSDNFKIKVLNSTFVSNSLTSTASTGSLIILQNAGVTNTIKNTYLSLISNTFYGNIATSAYTSLIYSLGRKMEVGACIFAQNNINAGGNGSDVRIITGKDQVTSLGYNVYNDFRLNGSSADPVNATDKKYDNTAWGVAALLLPINANGVMIPQTTNNTLLTTNIQRIPYASLATIQGVSSPVDQLGRSRLSTSCVGAYEVAPIITGATTATAFTTTYGTASATQTFSISGSYLNNDILATAPSGFEVSSDGSTYGTTATFTQSGSSVSGSLRIRLTANAAVSGNYNAKNIILSSLGATPVNITSATIGNAVSALALSITSPSIASKIYDGNSTSGTVTSGTLTGFVGLETLTVTAVTVLKKAADKVRS